MRALSARARTRPDRCAAAGGGTDGETKRANATVEIDYSGFWAAAGGNFGARLQLRKLPEGTVIPSRNNMAQSRLTGDLPVSNEDTMFAVTAAAAGSTGSFSATELVRSPTTPPDPCGSTGLLMPPARSPMPRQSSAGMSKINRHNASADLPGMYRWRVPAINNVPGGRIEVTYSSPQCGGEPYIIGGARLESVARVPENQGADRRSGSGTQTPTEHT